MVYVPWPCIPRKLTNDKAKTQSRRRASVLILLVDVCIKYVRMHVSALFSVYVSVLEFLFSKFCLKICTARSTIPLDDKVQGTVHMFTRNFNIAK